MLLNSLNRTCDDLMSAPTKCLPQIGLSYTSDQNDLSKQRCPPRKSEKEVLASLAPTQLKKWNLNWSWGWRQMAQLSVVTNHINQPICLQNQYGITTSTTYIEYSRSGADLVFAKFWNYIRPILLQTPSTNIFKSHHIGHRVHNNLLKQHLNQMSCHHLGPVHPLQWGRHLLEHPRLITGPAHSSY